jgi:amino acid adenylation domain-containing protein
MDSKQPQSPAAGFRGPDNPSSFPQEDVTAGVRALWQSVLGLPQVGLHDNFFEVGGTSLLATMLLSRINRAFGRDLPIAFIFEAPSVRTMAERLCGEGPVVPKPSERTIETQEDSQAVAIIGMTGRFPGAESVEDFWRNLAAGVESITFFKRSEVEARDQAAEAHSNGYIAARPILENADQFDAAFFGIYPKEAEQMDPQHRVFLECAWEALERAGYDPAHTRESVGVFAGCSMNTYFMQNLAAGRQYLEEFTGAYQVGSYVTMLGNDKDFLATRVSYKLNLRGPSITVQSACSTSLVAIAQACQSLLAQGCDMALAGAVSITFPQRRGYLPQEGGLASLDGHCRPFDQQASGTVFGHGAAVVLLKRLRDAVRDGDQVLAVIRGAAVNNDGAGKVGYTAPSVDGQAQVIVRAQKIANVPAESISYIEAHGTGTPLGDPIEVAALTKAFRASTQAKGFCALGTAKANVGHLDVAAGVTGLIKTVLQMEHRMIPKLLHFEQPNKHLDLENSPFVIHRELRPWERNGQPLRAGVSAFGVGGTNAHIIVEERPQLSPSDAGREYQLLAWSAKSANAAREIRRQLADCFAAKPYLNLADAAYTLQLSRSRHKHRRALVAGTLEEAHRALASESGEILREERPFETPSIVFCFPGQGVQSLGMGHQLYETEQVFREQLDRCAAILEPLIGESLLGILYPQQATPENERRLNQTLYAQPAIFAVEYALAQLWLSWGIHPAAMVGHSIGEYVAACLSGVLSLEDALQLVAARGRLMQNLAPGSMLAVRAPETSVREWIGEQLDLAAANSPQLSVISGADHLIDALSERLNREQVQNRKLVTSHAFHSRMVEPALASFTEHLRTVNFGKPSIPYVSTLTGTWITEEDLSRPEYWTRHIRQTVRFGDAIRELLRTSERIFLELGPGETAAQMIRQNILSTASNGAGGAGAPVVVSSLAIKRDAARNETRAILAALGRVWSAGAEPDWQAFHSGFARKRILLPTYPFERKRYWAEPPNSKPAGIGDAQPTVPKPSKQTETDTVDPGHATHSVFDSVRDSVEGSILPCTTQAVVRSQENRGARSLLPENAFHPAEEPIMTEAISNSTRPDSMLAEIKALVTDLSGVELTDVDRDASFLELGFDSLFLTQLTQAIQAKYRVKLTFREVMESYPTLGTLATHLESMAAPQRRVAPPAPASAKPANGQPAVETFSPQTVTNPLSVPRAAAASPSAAIPLPAPVVPYSVPAAADPLGSYPALFAAQVQALSALFTQQLGFLSGQRSAAPILASPGFSAVAPVTNLDTLAAPSAAEAPLTAVSTKQMPAAAPAESTTAEGKPQKPVFTPFKPLQRGASTDLNPVQHNYLREFIRSYNLRTPTSKNLTQQHRQVFADGRVVSGFNAQIKELIYPLIVDRASGAYLWDKDGNRYIDILNGFGAILYGHSPEFIVEAVRKQLETGFPIGPNTELAGQCAELIRDLTGMERTTFCNTGSEAVMGAMRLARTVTGRNLVVLFAGDYHGSFDEVLVKAVGNSGRSVPVAPGIPRESVSNILVLEYGAASSLEIIRQRASEIAAVLVEPVQSRHPELRPLEFLREVRQITAQSGAALIFDEVVTGFRTHPGGMQALFGIRADLATYGKVVAGGLPIGVLSGSAAYMDALDGGQWQFGDDSFPEAGVTFYAGTFMRHPLAMAAVKASLEHLKSSGASLQSALATKTASLAGDLQSMFHEFAYPASLETFSSWFFFGVPQEPRLARLLHFHLRHKGIHIQEGFPCFLTTAHTDADLDYVREAFRQSFREMQAGKALDGPVSHASEDSVLTAQGASSETSTVSHTEAQRAALVASAQPFHSTAPFASQEAIPVARDIPITEPQREVLFGTQLGDEANCAFNESTSLVLEGALDEPALIRSLEMLAVRHESLRSTVDKSGETIHIAASLEIAGASTLPLVREDLTALLAPEREAQLAEILKREASTPFDLYSGPLCRMVLIRLQAQKHVLVFTAHHIIFDGWSTNVLYGELSELYNSFVNRRPASLARALGFHEYANEQNRRAETPERAQVESYWLNKFKQLPPPLQLPTDRPRAALRSNAGATKRFVFPAELLNSIRKAGARQGSTLFATLLAGYSLLIHRLCQQNDVVIGIPMAGQSLVENGSTLVGHCVNFLPIRSSYVPEQPLSAFLKQTRKALLDAQEHQDYTYGTLLRKLKIERDPSRLQLVEVQFNLEQVGSGLKFEGLTTDLSANPKTSVNMDLFFNFVDRGTELWLDCDYNSDLFDATTIERWFEHTEAILKALVDNIDQPISEVSLLSARDVETMLSVWNRTATEYPRDSSIHRVFEQQVRLTPNRLAVIAERSLTYAELNQKANQLARFLQNAGVRPGARVALCLERSLQAVVSLLAILKAGAAYVPVDPSYPLSRLSYLIADSGVQVLISQRSVISSLPELPVNVIDLDADWPAIAVKEAVNLACDAEPGDQAYVMYTSGSTGNPKGVVVPQRAVLRLVRGNSFASFSSDEVFLQLAPLSFDAATFEIWGALLNGASLVLGPRGRLAPEEIGRLITAHGVTTLWLTAALFHLMASEHLDALRPLKQLLAGGDVLSLSHVRRVIEEIPTLRLINGYGPTENTTFTCCHAITLGSLAGGTVPIGKPIANTRIYLLDGAKKPVPIGVAGELYAAGDGLALEYLNSPELTSGKFLEHTFENGRRERLYRTGDLARYRADGTVEFLGREDTQVKIRGYRIELAEIEHVLESSPLVRSAVVAVRNDWMTANDTPGDKRLAAYVVTAEPVEASALIPELRKYLEQRLPQYMQPSAIMLLESLPRTLNGKVDRKALPAPQTELLIRQKTMVYPRNPKEETLATIWAKVLGIKEVGVEDSIFELGGDSLLIFRITTLANQSGLRLTARHIFQYRTVASICAQIENEFADGAAKTASAGIQAVPRARYRRPQTLVP